MPNDDPDNLAGETRDGQRATDGRSSLDQLSDAFAEMLRSDPPAEIPAGDAVSAETPDESASDRAEVDGNEALGEVTPQAVLEAMLFVGRPDNRSLSRHEIASLMRGVAPDDVDGLVDELNAVYVRQAAPYEIVSRDAGYRMQLRETYRSLRDKFYGRARRSRLSRAAIDVLSVVAFHQPVTREVIHRMRGVRSEAVVSQLIRRQLIEMRRGEDRSEPDQYVTTGRFLRIFGLESLDELPQCEDLVHRL